MTKLGGALGNVAAASSPAVVSRFLAALRTARPIRRIVVPLINLEAGLVLVGTDARETVEVETTRHFADRGLEQSQLTLTAWELHRTARLLAAAVVEWSPDLGVSAPPLGSWSEWIQLTPEILVELRMQFDDFSEEHDPAEARLTEEEVVAIRDAIAKKNGPALRVCGARRLSSYLLSTGDPPASSPRPTSSPGGFSPAS
jgi:hypothetical protein